MEPSLFDQIMKDYGVLRTKHSVAEIQPVMKMLTNKYCSPEFGLREEALYSLINYEYQQEMKKKLGQSQDWEDLYSRWKNSESLFALAEETGVSNALLGNKLLSGGRADGDSKGMSLDSNNIEDGRLAFEVMLSRYVDPFYGPFATFIAQNVGTVLEDRVERYLRKNGFQYLKESDMRERNFDVTPDFKLDIPVVVDHSDNAKLSLVAYKPSSLCTKCGVKTSCEERGSGGHDPKSIINWIECKSLFASVKCHQEYVRTQYNSYFNRFGRGLVIYGYGCVKDILADTSQFIILQNVQLE